MKIKHDLTIEEAELLVDVLESSQLFPANLQALLINDQLQQLCNTLKRKLISPGSSIKVTMGTSTAAAFNLYAPKLPLADVFMQNLVLRMTNQNYELLVQQLSTGTDQLLLE